MFLFQLGGRGTGRSPYAFGGFDITFGLVAFAEGNNLKVN